MGSMRGQKRENTGQYIKMMLLRSLGTQKVISKSYAYKVVQLLDRTHASGL